VGEPGAKDVLTQAGGRKPKPRAFFANSPAAIAKRASDVFVQLVIAAIATAPRGTDVAFGDGGSGAKVEDVSLGDSRS
jgi:hypothetical protein